MPQLAQVICHPGIGHRTSWYRSPDILAQVSFLTGHSGAGVLPNWRRCDFRVGTCAKKWAQMLSGGAGLTPFSTPAPKTATTCTKRDTTCAKRDTTCSGLAQRLFHCRKPILQCAENKPFILDKQKNKMVLRKTNHLIYSDFTCKAAAAPIFGITANFSVTLQRVVNGDAR